MFVLPAAIGTFLLVNLLCACTALGVGFAAGVWFFGVRNDWAEAQQAKAADRAIKTSNRLVEVARGVSSDVSQHTAKIQAISADLKAVDRNQGGVNNAVFTALDQIIAANVELQHRLDLAEQQIAQQAAEISTHETDARTDSLSKLSNRRAFDDELRRRLAEWERKQTPVTLLLLDIDHFKKLNDTYGHQTGDEVLRRVGKILRAQCREMDLPCRYGGEEFAVILPATPAAGACLLAERIRQAIEDSVTYNDGKVLKVTVSMGVAHALLGDDQPKIIRRADEGLYKSKAAGRNCGHWHNGSQCVLIGQPKTPAAPQIESNTAPPPVTAVMATDVRSASQATFIRVLKRRVMESHRFGIPLSLLHWQVTEFDAGNRQRKNSIAGQTLASVAKALEASLREMDILAPLDKGEFVMMMPGQTQAEVRQAVKRVQTAMNDLPVIEGELPLRIRYGIAELKTNETAPELLARARQALFATTENRRAEGI